MTFHRYLCSVLRLCCSRHDCAERKITWIRRIERKNKTDRNGLGPKVESDSDGDGNDELEKGTVSGLCGMKRSKGLFTT